MSWKPPTSTFPSVNVKICFDSILSVIFCLRTIKNLVAHQVVINLQLSTSCNRSAVCRRYKARYLQPSKVLILLRYDKVFHRLSCRKTELDVPEQKTSSQVLLKTLSARVPRRCVFRFWARCRVKRNSVNLCLSRTDKIKVPREVFIFHVESPKVSPERINPSECELKPCLCCSFTWFNRLRDLEAVRHDCRREPRTWKWH